MSRKIVKQTGSFIASDTEGRTYRIHVFTEYIDVSSRDREEWIPGMKSLCTNDGCSVNQLDKGQYQVVTTGALLSSQEPGAP
jgi:hypothetical protein